MSLVITAIINGIDVVGGGTVKFGNYFHSGSDILIITQNHNYDEGTKIPYDESVNYKTIVFEDFVWVGSNVIIVGNTTVGEGAIIAAGSVVLKMSRDAIVEATQQRLSSIEILNILKT